MLDCDNLFSKFGVRVLNRKPEFLIKHTNLLLIVVIIISGVIAYSNSFDCSFHFDDANVFHGSVTERTSTLADWIRLFPNRPVGIITFYLNYQIHGLDVWGYHLVNLIIHLANAFLVWWLTRLTLSTPAVRETEISRHKTWVAFLTALLFVTHPLATQSVTYIVQRFASLAALFYLLSIVLFAQGKLWQGDRKISWFMFGGAVLSALMGMKTKEIVFTLPFAILLYDFCFFKTTSWKWRLKDESVILAGLILLIFIVWTFQIVSFRSFDRVPPIQGYSYSISMKEYLFTQFSVILTYIRLFILPIYQNFDYDYPISNSFFHLRTFFSFALLMGILAAGVLLFKRYRLISFGIFWFFLTLSVESSIIPISQNVIFEHRTYLPGYGFFLVLTAACFYFLRGRYFRMAVVLLLILSTVYAGLTYQRNKVWKNEYTFWADVLKKSPNKARPNNNFGQVMLAQGKVKEAIYYYDRAIRLSPDFIYFYNNRGAAYAKLGFHQKAIEDYDQAIRLNKEHPGAYYNRAIAYAALGLYEKAMADYRQVILLRPDSADAYVNLGHLQVKLGRFQEAIESCSQAVRLRPRDPNGYYNRGEAYLKLGRYLLAIEDFSAAVRLQPGDYEAYYHRGTAYGKLGRAQFEIADYSQALRLKPDYAPALNSRAAAHFRQDETLSGCRDAQAACTLGACQTLDWAKDRGFCR